MNSFKVQKNHIIPKMIDSETSHDESLNVAGEILSSSKTIGNDSGNILNDFCLLQILNQMDIIDLCSLVCVSRQFKRVSMMLFRSRYKTLCYPEDLKSLSSTSYGRKKSQMRLVFSFFGHLIQSLKLRSSNGEFPCYDEIEQLEHLSRSDAIEIDVISKYCAGTLKELHVSSLPLEYVSTNGLLEMFSKLKYLHISECNGSVVQKFPDLDELGIEDFQLNFKKVVDLLHLNPQITKLRLLQNRPDQHMWKTCGDTRFIKVLKRLRKCAGSFGETRSCLDYIYMAIVVNSFCSESEKIIEAMQNIDLEQLTWLTLDDYPIEIKCIENILKFPKLRKLSLGTIDTSFDNFNTTLAEQLPLLSELNLKFKYNDTPLFSIDGLKTFIENTPKLYRLVIETNHTNCFDQNCFEILLTAVRRRLVVCSGANHLTITIVNNCNSRALRRPVVQWQLSLSKENLLEK